MPPLRPVTSESMPSGPFKRRPRPDGFFVSQGLSAGDEVVVQGSEALFAAEQNASVKTP